MGCCTSTQPTVQPQEDAFSTIIVNNTGGTTTTTAPTPRPTGGRRTTRQQLGKGGTAAHSTADNPTIPPQHPLQVPSTEAPSKSASPMDANLSGTVESKESCTSLSEDVYMEEDPSIMMDAVDIFTLILRADAATKQQWEILIVPLEYRGKTNRKKLREWIDEVGKLPRPVMVLLQDGNVNTTLTSSTLSQNHKMLVNMEQRLKSNRATTTSNASESTDSRRYSVANSNKMHPDYNMEAEQPINFLEELMEEERRYSDANLPPRFQSSSPGISAQRGPSRHRSNKSDTLSRNGDDSDSDGAVENGSAVSS